MNSSYAYTLSIWPSIITVVFLITLSFYGWRRRSEPGAFPFSFAALLAAFWAAGSVMEIAAEEIAAKIVDHQLTGDYLAFLVKDKAAAEKKNKYDVFKVLGAYGGDKALPPLSMLGY